MRTLFNRYSLWGKIFLALGVILLIAAAAMSFDFGWGVSAKHALFLAGLSFVTAFIPEAAYHQWKDGNKGASMALALCSIPLFGIEFFSHAGYTAGLRGLNVSETQVQNVKYDDARKDVEEQASMLRMFEQRLKDLQGENKWTVSVTADALRARMESLNLAIKLEEQKGGCKAKCLERTKERDDVASRIAVLERIDDTTAKIEATKKVIANFRDKSARTEHKSSAVEHQNAFLTKAVALTVNGSLEATAVQAEKVQQAVNLGMALAGTGLPALCFFAAGLYRRKEDEEVPHAKATSQAKPLAINVNDNAQLWSTLAKLKAS
jgi:hypothetical protein